MSRTLRIFLFGGVVVALWCFTSDRLLSRVAVEEGTEDAPRPEAAGESDYQVVKLLSKLFTSIKRNHVEVKSLHRQYCKSGDAAERDDLRGRLGERISFIEGKAREYHQLVPSLAASYPTLKTVIQSFSRDLKTISGDLDLIKQTDGIAHGSRDEEPRRESRHASDRSFSHESSGSGHAKGELTSDDAEPQRREKRGLAQDAELGAVVVGTESHRSAGSAEERMGSEAPLARPGPVVPITLEVRGEKGDGIDRRKIVFRLGDHVRGMKGFLDQSNLVPETVAYTDQQGRATVRLQLEGTSRAIKIKRTIIPKEDHTLCRLESAE